MEGICSDQAWLMAMRLRECAVHMDNAHMREYADVDENLIHIYQHTQYYRGKQARKLQDAQAEKLTS